jgi:hypothetical protein
MKGPTEIKLYLGFFIICLDDKKVEGVAVRQDARMARVPPYTLGLGEKRALRLT